MPRRFTPGMYPASPSALGSLVPLTNVSFSSRVIAPTSARTRGDQPVRSDAVPALAVPAVAAPRAAEPSSVVSAANAVTRSARPGRRRGVGIFTGGFPSLSLTGERQPRAGFARPTPRAAIWSVARAEAPGASTESQKSHLWSARYSAKEMRVLCPPGRSERTVFDLMSGQYASRWNGEFGVPARTNEPQ